MVDGKPGRPRKFANPAARQRAYRAKWAKTGRRVDAWIDDQAYWRLDALAREWDCSRAAAIERLILEADQRYGDILFPAGVNQGKHSAAGPPMDYAADPLVDQPVDQAADPGSNPRPDPGPETVPGGRANSGSASKKDRGESRI